VRKVYIAAPLFNIPQIELIRYIEHTLRANHTSFFSPRSLHDGAGTSISNVDQARYIKSANKSKLRECNVLLAVMDFRLPEGRQLAVVERRPLPPVVAQVIEGGQESYFAVTSPLNLPDTGVAWELGFYEALIDNDEENEDGRQIVLYYHDTAAGKPNVMLAQGRKVIFGGNQLQAWAGGGWTPPVYSGPVA
jgi:hypothetical protein